MRGKYSTKDFSPRALKKPERLFTLTLPIFPLKAV